MERSVFGPCVKKLGLLYLKLHYIVGIQIERVVM